MIDLGTASLTAGVVVGAVNAAIDAAAPARPAIGAVSHTMPTEFLPPSPCEVRGGLADALAARGRAAW